MSACKKIREKRWRVLHGGKPGEVQGGGIVEGKEAKKEVTRTRQEALTSNGNKRYSPEKTSPSLLQRGRGAGPEWRKDSLAEM